MPLGTAPNPFARDLADRRIKFELQLQLSQGQSLQYGYVYSKANLRKEGIFASEYVIQSI